MIKRIIVFGPKRPKNEFRRSSRSIRTSPRFEPAQRFDLQYYHAGILYCENKRFQFHTGTLLEAYKGKTMEPVDALDYEMVG
jgi:hypothetical protein